jgi:hypothetical protein
VHEGLADALETAAWLKVSRGFVYEHADELGALRLGTGRTPPEHLDFPRARPWTLAYALMYP